MKIFGHGLVWDSERNCPAFQFVDGVYETDDKRTIAIATKAGFVQGDEIAETIEKEEQKLETDQFVRRRKRF